MDNNNTLGAVLHGNNEMNERCHNSCKNLGLSFKALNSTISILSKIFFQISMSLEKKLLKQLRKSKRIKGNIPFTILSTVMSKTA